jgi:hypothetical protein
MEKDFQTIREILIRLFRHQRSRLTSGLPEYDKLYYEYPPMDNESQIVFLMSDLTHCISDFYTYGKYLYLPPIKKDENIVPILLFDCDLSKSKDEISFTLILFRFLNETGIPEKIAFRFEGPEGIAGGLSKHNYWHMQVTNTIESRNGYQKTICRKWLPVKTPCTPIVCRCPVSLLLCLLFSFYGIQMFDFFESLDIENQYLEPLKPILPLCC